jgi:hypothetical protein
MFVQFEGAISGDPLRRHPWDVCESDTFMAIGALGERNERDEHQAETVYDA